MLKRWLILTALLLFIPLTGCKKSGGDKVTNFFGAPPKVSEVSVTKERKDFQCTTSVDLCCVDPPLCTCCCSPDAVTDTRASLDLVTASAKVVDPTPPDGTNPNDILVVVLRFLDPPPASVPPGTQINQISLEMFDTGPVSVGQLNIDRSPSPPLLIDIHSGDAAANDGQFTRKFYFTSTTAAGAGTCVSETDKTNQNFTYSTYGTSRNVEPTISLSFQFTVQAIDRSGNIDTSTELALAIQGTYRDQSQITRACGAPSGNGGCLPGP